MGGIAMNENLDLTKILDGCPEGTEFYSTIFGTVNFREVDNEDSYPIRVKVGNTIIRHKEDGRYDGKYAGECVLFTSKDQRYWSKFERFWDKPKVEKFDPKTLQPFDRVLVRDNDDEKWDCDLFSYYDENQSYPYVFVSRPWSHCIPYNDETKHLVGTIDDCPEYYKWWEE